MFSTSVTRIELVFLSTCVNANFVAQILFLLVCGVFLTSAQTVSMAFVMCNLTLVIILLLSFSKIGTTWIRNGASTFL